MDPETLTLLNAQQSKSNQDSPLNNAEVDGVYGASQFQPRNREQYISYGSINGVRSLLTCF